MSSKGGRSTGATIGVLNTIKKLIRENADVVSAVFVGDGGMSKRRLEVFPEYKGKRRASNEAAKALLEAGVTEDGEPLPTWKDRFETTVAGRLKKVDINDPKWKQALRRAFSENADDLRAILPKLGIRMAQLRGREADDVVARIATDKALSGEHCLILSEDKDFIPLVNDRITLYRPITEQMINQATLHTYIQVPQWFFLVSRAIEGDDSDEIPGVHGVGEKTIADVVALLEEPTMLNGNSFHEHVCDQIIGACRSFIGDKRAAGRMLKLAAGIDTVKRNVELMDLMIESQSLSPTEEDQLYDTMEAYAQLAIPEAVAHLRGLDAVSAASELEISDGLDFRCLEPF